MEQAEEGEQAAVAEGGEKEEEAGGKEGAVEDAADVAAVAEAEDEEKEEEDEQEKKDEEEEGEEGEEAAAPPADAAPTAAEVSASRLSRSCPVTLHAAFQLTACGLALPRCITSLASTPLPPTYICCFYRLLTSPHTSPTHLYAASATLPPSPRRRRRQRPSPTPRSRSSSRGRTARLWRRPSMPSSASPTARYAYLNSPHAPPPTDRQCMPSSLFRVFL